MPKTRQVRGCDECAKVTEVVIEYVDGTGSDGEEHRIYVDAVCANGHPYDISRLHPSST